MFQIGALNPQVGNDRRNQLLQKLMQQYTGQQGGGLALPATNLMRQTPALGTASRASSMAAPGGRPDFTGGNPISSFLENLLGPGGFGRVPGNRTSPGPGVPVPGLRSVDQGPNGQPIGSPWGGGGPLIPSSPGSTPVPAGHIGTSITGPSMAPATQPIGHAPTGPNPLGLPTSWAPPTNAVGLPTSWAPPPGQAAATNAVGLPMSWAPPSGTTPGPSPTTSNGLIPLGNGVFYQPGVGVVGSPMGGLGAGVQGVGPRTI
jgi:hypothetical protein